MAEEEHWHAFRAAERAGELGEGAEVHGRKGKTGQYTEEVLPVHGDKDQ